MTSMTTLGETRHQAIQKLSVSSPTPALDVDLLISTALQVDRAWILAHPEAEIPPEAQAQLTDWIARAVQGEPIAYLIGVRGFYDLEFIVTPDVLIPRPETELLLEDALIWLRGRPDMIVADIGTGSGALAVSLAKHTSATVYAVDISPQALAIASQNAHHHGVAHQLHFLEGSLYSPLMRENIHPQVVVANLPYIPAEEVPTLAVSRYEPSLALDGGSDGLRLVELLLSQIDLHGPSYPQLILLEIGAGQGEATIAIARQYFPNAAVTCQPDYAGHDRRVSIVL